MKIGKETSGLQKIQHRLELYFGEKLVSVFFEICYKTQKYIGLLNYDGKESERKQALAKKSLIFKNASSNDKLEGKSSKNNCLNSSQVKLDIMLNSRRISM